MTTPPKDRLDNFIERPRRAMWVLAAPMIAGMMVHAGYSIVDSIFIGKLGSDALAAAGYIGALFFAAIALTGGLSTGITATVAKAYGARDAERVSNLANNGFVLCIAVAGVFSGLGVFFAKQIIPLLGAEGKSAWFAWEYMRPLWMAMPLFFITTAFRSVLNGEGDSRTPMIILAAATLINLGLDPVFIFVLDYGIAGAAYATIVAQTFALFALLYVVFVRRMVGARFELSRMRLKKSYVGAIVGLGAPAAAGHLVMAAGMVLINRVIAEFGQTAVAGYVAGNRIDMFVALPLMGIAAGAMTLIGMFSGAGRRDLVWSTTLYAYRWAVLSSLMLGVTAYLFADTVVGLFVNDEHALFIGRQYVGYAVFAYPLMAIGMISGRILQGLGYGLPTMVITSVRVLLIGVTGAYVSVYLFDSDITAVWLSFIAGGTGAAGLSIFWVRKHIRVREEG